MTSCVAGDPDWPGFARELAHHMGRPPGRPLRPEDRLIEDLALDSITIFEIVILLEDRAGRLLDDQFLESLTTVGDVFVVLKQFSIG